MMGGRGVPTASALLHVLDVFGHLHPGVHALLIDGDGGARERRLSECADRDSNVLLAAFGHVVHRRTADWAEVE